MLTYSHEVELSIRLYNALKRIRNRGDWPKSSIIAVRWTSWLARVTKRQEEDAASYAYDRLTK